MSVIAILSGAISLMSAFLIVHDKYEDGFFGRVALAGLVLAGVIVVMSEVDGYAKYYAPPEVILLIASVAGFQLRHVYRFLKWSRTGHGEWRKIGKKCG